MLYLRVHDHTTLEEETIARMDDSGHIRDTAEVEKTLERANQTEKSAWIYDAAANT